MAGGAIGRNLIGRLESMSGRVVPFAGVAVPTIGRGVTVTGLPAMTQMGGEKVGPLEQR